MTLATCLVDSNILLRAAFRNAPDHELVSTALVKLISNGTALCFTHQNIAEFWNAATRPKESNGFGIPFEAAEREVVRMEYGMRLLPDSAAVYHEWRRIVNAHKVQGVQVHDARIAAAMIVHGVSHILTLNVKHFNRFDGIVALHPESV
jgi:predicted nucleic acid-binding protein